LVFTYESLFAEKKIKIDKKIDLYVYFFLRGINLLAEKGVLCFICSNSWLDVGYGKSLQETLLKTTRIKTVIDNSAKRSFEKADVNTTINILVKDSSVDKEEGHQNTGKKKSLSTEKLVRFIVFKDDFEKTATPNEINLINTTTKITSNEKWRVYPISQNDLYKSGLDEYLNYEGDKWGGKYLRAPDIYLKLSLSPQIATLASFGAIKLGITSCQNDYFYLTADEINLFKIPSKYLAPIFKSPQDSKQIFVDPALLSNKVFICNEETVRDKYVLKYIGFGLKNKVHKVECLKTRKLWYSLGEPDISNIAIPYSYNDTFKVFFSEPKCISDKRLVQFFPDHKYDELSLALGMNSSIWALFTESNGTANLGEGALVFNTKDFRKIPFFYYHFDDNIKKSLQETLFTREIKSIFEECGFDKTKPIRSQKPNPLPDRKALDDIIFNALGLTQAERIEVYYAVCELVQNRLNKARSV